VSKQRHDVARYGWPNVLGRQLSAAYTGKHPTTLDKARREGKLRAAGRLGGTGERVYTRAELDRWLTGLPADPPAAGDDLDAAGDDLDAFEDGEGNQ
jgi:hypothetical protein